MADGKWVTGLSADASAAGAAEAVLAARLGAVRRALPPAVERAAEDPEHVHQLRVATRRAGAAVRIFRAVLPRKRDREARRVLRAVRQAAGGARDWDVFLDRVTASGDEADGPARDFLAGYALGERAAAQRDLAAVAAAEAGPLGDVCDSLPGAARARRRAPGTFGELGAEVLAELVAGFADKVAAGPDTPAALHELRIVGKRVRYALEVFAECFAPPVRDALYPAVERVQELLGDVQDGHVLTDRLAGILTTTRAARPALAARVEPGIEALRVQTDRQTRDQTEAFRDWAHEWRDLLAAHPLPELFGATVGAGSVR